MTNWGSKKLMSFVIVFYKIKLLKVGFLVIVRYYLSKMMHIFLYVPNFQAYIRLKTLSEKKILSYNNKEGKRNFEVVSLTCGLVGGDTILPYTPETMYMIISPLIKIENLHNVLKTIQALLGSIPLVHVEDVCEAHVFCIEQPVMADRFFCAVDYPTEKELMGYFAKEFPDLNPIKE
jgi:nucleoside-diphosphate-sugar epimerase